MNASENTLTYNVGDIIIGSSDPSKSVYSATGAKLIEDGVRIHGDETSLKNKQKEFMRMVRSHGGVAKQLPENKNIVTQSKKVKKTSYKNTSVPDYLYFEDEPGQNTVVQKKEQITVQFENDFGKIKAKVDNVVNHEQAYLLIFENEESVVFEPKVGEKLLFHTPTAKNVQVYYPGVTFNSPESDQKLMILFKVPSEEN